MQFNKCYFDGFSNIVEDAKELKLIVQDMINTQMGVVQLEVVVKYSFKASHIRCQNKHLLQEDISNKWLYFSASISCNIIFAESHNLFLLPTHFHLEKDLP